MNSAHEGVASIHQVQAMLVLLDVTLRFDTFAPESAVEGDPPAN